MEVASLVDVGASLVELDVEVGASLVDVRASLVELEVEVGASLVEVGPRLWSWRWK